MPKTVGIDLGTTNSVIAVMEGGEPVVIPNSEGSRTTPSVVAFTKSGERLVGTLARRQAAVNPENTVYSIKRFMGRKFGEVDSERKIVPYEVKPGKFDRAGGTFDVAVLDVGGGVVEVTSTNGDTHLGGDDYGRRIVDWLADEFKKQNGIDLKTDRQALQRLTEAAERAKIELSSRLETTINLPFITADQTGPKHLEMTLTRAKFESLTSDLTERTRGPFLAALKDANLTPQQIDEVVLVGGSTRMPIIQQLVKDLLGGKEPHKGVNPDEVVAVDPDANGSLNGKAQDKGTGREQSVTITASSTLNKDEVDRMVKEAEAHSAEDRAKREEVELRNQADHMIHQAEKVIKDNEARIPEDVKSEVDTKLEALKTAAKGSDTKDLQRKMDEFNEALQKIGQHIYQGAGASTPGGAAEDGSPAGEKKKEEDVVDADYREVN